MTIKPVTLPKTGELYKFVLEALIALGGSGAVEEIEDGVTLALKATKEQIDAVYAKSGAAVLPDRISWARSWLKWPGFVTNPSRGVWVLTEEGRAAATKSSTELKQIVSAAYKAAHSVKKMTSLAADEIDLPLEENVAGWAEQLLARMQHIDPGAFERLSQRLLRESGFTKVEVSGKTGDGGIDGAGVLRVNLISFQVLFQCKRWKGSVGSEVVRNFRGAMQGRADKGLIITTGTFTGEARKEATRDGTPAIDLIDGEALCDLMKSLGLGVHVEKRIVEDIILDEKFFDVI